ncbi:hypothetical protein D5F01_LYC01429 [Larimichthys crocea]|uniref:Uncharacterized protein n=1 Tax=Larimichthys crocea TaxID=215358 RepID=A0A6G0J5J8_LARCR|nr:hypothetical protein D5F01_LYC01429 [Larimichthys crocea]
MLVRENRHVLTGLLLLGTRWTHGASGTSSAWGALSLEDIEDVHIFGSLIAGVLMIGMGMALIYLKTGKLAANKESPKLSAVIAHHGGAVADQVKELQQKIFCGELTQHKQLEGETKESMAWSLMKKIQQIASIAVETGLGPRGRRRAGVKAGDR